VEVHCFEGVGLVPLELARAVASLEPPYFGRSQVGNPHGELLRAGVAQQVASPLVDSEDVIVLRLQEDGVIGLLKEGPVTLFARLERLVDLLAISDVDSRPDVSLELAGGRKPRLPSVEHPAVLSVVPPK